MDSQEKETRDLFEKVRSHTEPYDVEINGIKIVVYPNVFSPMYFNDSEWFSTELSKIVGYNKTLLEIGSGTGIIGLFCARAGAKVTATDINPSAVENTKSNFEKYNLPLKVYLGDLYSPLSQDEKFDYIFWNHPYNRGTNPSEELLLKSGFDYKYTSLEGYIKGAHLHLNNGGHLLLGTSSFADSGSIQVLAMKFGYSLKLLKSVRMPISGHPGLDNEYYIYELVRR